MPTTSLLVLSDLHLADGRNALEGFHSQQQTSFTALLRAALPGGSLGNLSAPLLILNGDTYDFLAVPPYPADGMTTPQLGLIKLERIATAHELFFLTLRDFLDEGGEVTFVPGNHDVELCFAEVRARVAALIDPDGTREERLHFCLDRYYQPRPDVWIEHGNQYDFWNYAGGIWDETGLALTPAPEEIALPLGTQYMQRAALPISLHYPYFEHFDPPLGIARQIALLSLLDPALVVQTARGVATMMSNGHQPLQGLASGDENVPVQLFAHAMTDFAAFQQDMLARSPHWPALEDRLYTTDERELRQADTLGTFFGLREALEKGADPALQAIFQPLAASGDEDTTRGMQRVLRDHPDVRVAIAGHTHVVRSEYSVEYDQLYLNTATWTQRFVPPVSTELTNIVLDWLRTPELAQCPLPDKTAFVFAWISALPNQPSTARLCTWEGGDEGSYREI